MSNLYASTRRLSFIDCYLGLPIEMPELSCSEWGEDNIQAVIKIGHMVEKALRLPLRNM